MSVTLYTTHCPKCKVLESKLNSKNIAYDEVTDVEEMTRLGFQAVPMLKVDDTVMDFMGANQWLNNYKEG